jgi:endoribonuclease LACTB2
MIFWLEDAVILHLNSLYNRPMDAPLILTVHGTHFYLVRCTGGLLLIDAGWEMDRFKAEMKTHRAAFNQIRWVMFTHHHPDHAGLVQSVRDLSGARLIIHEKQIPYLETLRDFYARRGGYDPIRIEQGDLVSPDRAALGQIGISGEILETPGHSPDSISLLLDSGAAFIGDLTAPDMVSEENAEEVHQSWKKLIARGAQVFYHSHTDPIPADLIQLLLSNHI